MPRPMAGCCYSTKCFCMMFRCNLMIKCLLTLWMVSLMGKRISKLEQCFLSCGMVSSCGQWYPASSPLYLAKKPKRLCLLPHAKVLWECPSGTHSFWVISSYAVKRTGKISNVSSAGSYFQQCLYFLYSPCPKSPLKFSKHVDNIHKKSVFG